MQADPPYSLHPYSVAELQTLAASGRPEPVASRAVEGALPPPFVALRSLKQLSEGKSLFWCSTFYIVRNSDRMIIGGCGFKDEPLNGRVEIGYAVSPSCQGRGVATACVGELLRLAFASDEVSEVLAEINPANFASARVVEKLDFERGEMVLDEDQEMAVQWLARKPHHTH